MSVRSHRVTCGALTAAQLLAGCSSWRTVSLSPRALVDSAHVRAIQVTETRGARYVLNAPRVTTDSLIGTVVRPVRGNSVTGEAGYVARTARGVSLAAVDHLAVARLNPWKTVLWVVVVPAAALVALVAATWSGPYGIDFSGWR